MLQDAQICILKKTPNVILVVELEEEQVCSQQGAGRATKVYIDLCQVSHGHRVNEPSRSPCYKSMKHKKTILK